MTGDLIIALTPIGTIVGREKKGKSGFYLKDAQACLPRSERSRPDGHRASAAAGRPRPPFIPSSTPFYDNKDGALEEAYTRSTTSLVLSQAGKN